MIELTQKEAETKRYKLFCSRDDKHIAHSSDTEDAIYHAINKASSMTARHITVDDLPKVRIDKRNGYPDYYKPIPKPQRRTPPKTRAKRAAALAKKMRDGTWDNVKRGWTYPGDDKITHVESGRVWDASTGATAAEFLGLMQQHDQQQRSL